MTSAAEQLLGLCDRLDIKYVFSNLGSDHPAFIDAFARMHAAGSPMPKIVICPHEMTALSAAHGYAMITRQPQLVLVHVDVGTQNLGGSVHNAARARIPAIILAGLSPVTDDGSRVASRNEFIHYTQDTPRQHEIVGQYMKWSYELRAAEMVDDVLLRAKQIATTAPEGPVYITGAREIWEEPVAASSESSADWPRANLGGLTEAGAADLYQALCGAQRPIVVTTYLGRQPQAVARLVELSNRVGIGICQVSPQYQNFPGNHPHQLTYRRNQVIDQADLILMIDVDVPWMPSKVRPAAGARLFHIDMDPIKDRLGYWHFPAQRAHLADSLIVLDQLLAITGNVVPGRVARTAWIASIKAGLHHATVRRTGAISAEELTEAVRELVTERTIIVFEEPSSTELIPDILRMSTPGSYFSSGGAGLGWGINAAIGAKLASPQADVISLVGDGCFLFGVPSSAYWVAGTYGAPHLTIIYNNGGWHSPRLSTVWVHPDGPAERNDTYWVTSGAGARLPDIAAATGGAEPFWVTEREHLSDTLKRALQTVRRGRSAVVDVAISRISQQVLG